MLNATLLALALRSWQSSPLLAGSPLAAPSAWRLHNIRASQFFAPFAFNLANARYSRCSFAHMLNSAISVSSRTYRNQHTELTLFAHTDEYVEVIDSDFYSENMLAGGAINILKEGSTLSVVRTNFRHCSAGYRGGAISFFGQHLILEYVCFMRCESSDSAMAIESHLDPHESSMKMTNVQVTLCADEETMQEFRFASLYFIFGAQSGRNINSTMNDAVHGGSFAATEDSDSFDFQNIICCNNSGRSSFEFEDLTPEAVFAHVNVLAARPSGLSFEDSASLFVLSGSVVTLRQSAIFGMRLQYIARNGELTFDTVVTDLPKVVPLLSAKFAEVGCSFGQLAVKTVKLKGFPKLICDADEGTIRSTPTASRPQFDFGGEENMGILTFLVIAGLSGIGLFVYYAFIRKPDEYKRLGDLVALPFER